MQIGVLSKRTGVSVRMLRYYEQEGLLQPSRRAASGYRDYGAADEEAVRRILRLNAAGLKLDVIRRFLPCVTSDKPDFHPCPALLATLQREVSAMEARIALLEENRALIAGYLNSVANATASETLAKKKPPALGTAAVAGRAVAYIKRLALSWWWSCDLSL